MKLRVSMGLAVIAVAIATSAYASATASAASWWVGGKPLTASSLLEAKTTTVENMSLKGIGIEVVCQGIELKSASISAPSGGQMGHLVYTECNLEGLQGCTLKSTEIESKPLKIEASLGAKNPEDFLVLKPSSGTTFTEFAIEGEACGLAGGLRLQGKAKFKLPKGQSETAEQVIEAHAEPGELKWESEEILLKGKVKAKLTSGAAWGFH